MDRDGDKLSNRSLTSVGSVKTDLITVTIGLINLVVDSVSLPFFYFTITNANLQSLNCGFLNGIKPFEKRDCRFDRGTSSKFI